MRKTLENGHSDKVRSAKNRPRPLPSVFARPGPKGAIKKPIYINLQAPTAASQYTGQRRYTLRDGSGEQALFDDCVDSPIAVDNLRNAEIDSYRDQRDRLILSQSLCHHQERSHFTEGVFQREID
jgi:hypothetical protein